MAASSREEGKGPGASHEEGIECWVWGWRANEDYAWFFNRDHGYESFLGHRWQSAHE